ncbi:MAG: redox-regulated ATPase YchF [Candidatus Nitrosopolaris sp.]
MLIGLIGKANVGKSTFFNAATELEVQTANYPFTTINSNIGMTHARVKCVCKEFQVQDNPIHSVCVEGTRFIPIRLIDVPGLVEGAHQGKGLGNRFLDDARQADALIHVIDASASTDREGKPVSAGTADPSSDIKLVEEEFDYWLVSIVGREWTKVIRDAAVQKLEQVLAKRLSGLAIKERSVIDVLNETGLDKKKPVNWTEQDLLEFCQKIRLRSKPVIIAANKADLQAANGIIAEIKSRRQEVIPCSAEAESLLRRAAKRGVLNYLPGDNSFDIKSVNSLSGAQKKALDLVKSLLGRYGSTGVQEVINHVCFNLLKLIVVYPVEDEVRLTDKKGNVLPDARLIPQDSNAKDLARLIHDDLAKGFLYGIDVRTKQRLGAEHKLKHNDIIKIVSATSRG